MNEEHKINEASYFFGRLNPDEQTPLAFSYDLSAFLSAARSALQYAHQEASKKVGGQDWYATAIGAGTAIKFFKDKRDVSIHVAPVVPQRNVFVQITEHIRVTASVSMTVDRAGGTVEKEVVTQPEPPPPAAPPSTTSVTTIYRFQDWPGQEDVCTLCYLYLSEVRAVVLDGQRRGILTR